jgi:hypothetical protein
MNEHILGPLHCAAIEESLAIMGILLRCLEIVALDQCPPMLRCGNPSMALYVVQAFDLNVLLVNCCHAEHNNREKHPEKRKPFAVT